MSTRGAKKQSDSLRSEWSVGTPSNELMGVRRQMCAQWNRPEMRPYSKVNPRMYNSASPPRSPSVAERSHLSIAVQEKFYAFVLHQ